MLGRVLVLFVLVILCVNDSVRINCRCQASASHLSPRRRPEAQVSAITIRGGEAAWQSGIKNSFASALAAASSKLLLAPLDTIKTLQQSQRASGQATLTLIQTAKEIMKRPKGILELYVRSQNMKFKGKWKLKRN